MADVSLSEEWERAPGHEFNRSNGEVKREGIARTRLDGIKGDIELDK